MAEASDRAKQLFEILLSVQKYKKTYKDSIDPDKDLYGADQVMTACYDFNTGKIGESDLFEKFYQHHVLDGLSLYNLLKQISFDLTALRQFHAFVTDTTSAAPVCPNYLLAVLVRNPTAMRQFYAFLEIKLNTDVQK